MYKEFEIAASVDESIWNKFLFIALNQSLFKLL